MYEISRVTHGRSQTASTAPEIGPHVASFVPLSRRHAGCGTPERLLDDCFDAGLGDCCAPPPEMPGRELAPGLTSASLAAVATLARSPTSHLGDFCTVARGRCGLSRLSACS